MRWAHSSRNIRGCRIPPQCIRENAIRDLIKAVASNKAKGHGGKGATVAVAIVSAFVAIGFAAYITRRTRTGKDTSFVDTSFESDTADPEIQPYSGENPGDIQII